MKLNVFKCRLLSKRGFSLVELLVVIAVLAILIGLLTPALRNAHDKTKQIGCVSNQKSIGASMVFYAEDWNDAFPTTYKDGGAQQHCWMNLLGMAYLGLPGKNETNRQAEDFLFYLDENVTVFTCPSASDLSTHKRSYAKNQNMGEIWNKYMGANEWIVPHAGMISDVVSPEKTQFMMDSGVAGKGSVANEINFSWWLFNKPGSGLNAYVGGSKFAPYGGLHNSFVNTLFVDGHVDRVDLVADIWPNFLFKDGENHAWRTFLNGD